MHIESVWFPKTDTDNKVAVAPLMPWCQPNKNNICVIGNQNVWSRIASQVLPQMM